MKKILLLFLNIFIVLSLTGCSLLFEYRVDAINHFDIGYSEVLNEAFVSSYNWDGSDETKNIVIPEDYNGIKITALGGYYGKGVPCAFGIDLEETYLNNFCDRITQWHISDAYNDVENVDMIYLNINLHISKNIEQIKEHTLDCFYVGKYFDGKEYHTKIIAILYNITCDDGNKIFYAKNGKLFYRQNDSLVSDILYTDFGFLN